MCLVEQKKVLPPNSHLASTKIRSNLTRYRRKSRAERQSITRIKAHQPDDHIQKRDNRNTALARPLTRGNAKWNTSTIESILTNEKYKGSAILQKKFTVDFLTKKVKKNEGEVPQYYVEHSHPAIIAPEEWEQVQKEYRLRKSYGRHRNSLSPFSSKIICGDCGSFYGAKVWHSTS